jgi:hypothetical protein
MANEEHIKLVLAGSEEVRKWRAEQQSTKVLDLSGANLSGKDLTDYKLMDCNLEGAKLVGTNLRRVDLSGANLGRSALCHLKRSPGDTELVQRPQLSPRIAAIIQASNHTGVSVKQRFHFVGCLT